MYIQHNVIKCLDKYFDSFKHYINNCSVITNYSVLRVKTFSVILKTSIPIIIMIEFEISKFSVFSYKTLLTYTITLRNRGASLHQNVTIPAPFRAQSCTPKVSLHP